MLSVCDSALTYWILCKLDHRRQSYEVILILQDGGHIVANLLPVWFGHVWHLGRSRAIGIPTDIAIHGRYITTSGFWKETAAILKFYFRFDSDLFAAIGMWFSTGIPNFVEIGSSAAELWRHSDFQDGGRQPCWISFRVPVAHPRSADGALCCILKFRLDLIYSLR